MQERIDHLESLVTRLASQDNPIQIPAPGPSLATNKMSAIAFQNGTESTDNPVDEIRHGVGVMKVCQGKSQYRGSTHWGDVFQEVSGRIMVTFITANNFSAQ